jgi:type III restriction enzyme
VRFYARNDGLGLTIPYEYCGVDCAYEPDFVVRMAVPQGEPDLTIVLEIKGHEDNQTAAKEEGARRWVRAVNAWGKLGRWDFHVCRNPQKIVEELAVLLRKNQSAAT